MIKALVFDVFGTCVDWRGSVISELQRTGLNADWDDLADEWRRDGYIGPIRRILNGEQPYVSSDVLFRRTLGIGRGPRRVVAIGLAAGPAAATSTWTRASRLFM